MRDINDRLEEMAEGDSIQELFLSVAVVVEEDIGFQRARLAEADIQTTLNDARAGDLSFAGRVESDKPTNSFILPLEASLVEFAEVDKTRRALNDAVKSAGFTPESTVVQADSERRTL